MKASTGMTIIVVSIISVIGLAIYITEQWWPLLFLVLISGVELDDE